MRAVATEALPALAKGAIVVDHTTASAAVAREMAALAAKAAAPSSTRPVSGGQAGAEKGTLTVMLGGDEAACERARPVIGAYGKTIQRIGDSGAGQLAKMVNQICIAGTVQGLAEAIHFAKRAGIDADAVLAAISKGAAQSWQMENRWPTMVKGEFEFGFAVDWMRKDLGLVLDEARANGSTLALTALVDQFYADVQKLGGRRWDTSSLLKRLEELSPISLIGKRVVKAACPWRRLCPPRSRRVPHSFPLAGRGRPPGLSRCGGRCLLDAGRCLAVGLQGLHPSPRKRDGLTRHPRSSSRSQDRRRPIAPPLHRAIRAIRPPRRHRLRNSLGLQRLRRNRCGARLLA